MARSPYGSMGSSIGNPGGFTGRTPGPAGYAPAAYPTVAPVPTYAAPVPTSAIQPVQNMGYNQLAVAADKERQAMAAREAARQSQVMAGYQQQLENSRRLGEQGYSRLQSDYAPLVADAAATRARNMGRIDQYGQSMRADLDAKARQAMAAAQQSAIQRGLGNTTIRDSLMRGQAFDNARQQMSLEDQLLQNRIATDSQLSGVYQGALQNRAQGLNQQWNQNIGVENQIQGNRLGYLGSIQENMDGFNTVANLYTQKLQMENQNQQAQLEREARNPQMYGQYGSGVRLGMPRRRSGI